MFKVIAFVAILSRETFLLRVMQNCPQSFRDTPWYVRTLIHHNTRYRLPPSGSLHPCFLLVHNQTFLVNDVPDPREKVSRLGSRLPVATECQIIGVAGVDKTELLGHFGETRVQAACQQIA